MNSVNNKIRFEFKDGRIEWVDDDKVEEFIFDNLGKLKSYKFKPRGPRRSRARK